MRKTRIEKKRIYTVAAIILLVVFLLSAAFVLMKIWDKQLGKFPVSDVGEAVVEHSGSQYVLKENVETFLVMGLDKYDGASTADSYNNDMQADFLMLLVFDKNEKEFSAIHINRDTMASVNILGVAGQKVGTVNKQIALAHTYGNGKEVSCRNTADSVSSVLCGMKVNHYISLTMDSVPVFNDLVGGVEVEILDDFTGIDSTLVKGETVTLKGEQALKYIRSRQGLEDSTNSTRMKRQKQYIKALYEKTQKLVESDEEFVVDASLKMADYTVSDRSVTQLQEILKRISTYDFTGIKSIEGENKVGEEFIEFYPEKESVENIVIDLFYEEKSES